jgi:cysteine desulfurase/selenocysteine lyase
MFSSPVRSVIEAGMPTWDVDLRAKFPATRTWTYLNSATAGPLALETARAGCEVYESMLGGGDADWEAMVKNVDAARDAVSRLVACRPTELAFTRNTSHSVSLVAQMLWDAGHRKIVALEDEFPASTLPFLNRGFDVQFVPAEAGAYPIERIAEALKGRTVLVSSHVMYRTGAVLDPVALGALAEANGALLVLCVTQSLGALRVNFQESRAAFLVGTGHKWLCAGYGAGVLAIRSDLIGRLPWPAAGWLSQREPNLMRNDTIDFLPEARVVEMGCGAFPSVLALGAAARLWLATGPDRVQARVQELTARFQASLRAAGFALPERDNGVISGITIVPFSHAADASEVLTDARISQVARGTGIRFALHAFNNEADLDRALKGLLELRAQLLQ